MTQNIQKCFGTLKPESGTCRNCTDYQICLEASMQTTIAISGRDY